MLPAALTEAVSHPGVQAVAVWGGQTVPWGQWFLQLTPAQQDWLAGRKHHANTLALSPEMVKSWSRMASKLSPTPSALCRTDWDVNLSWQWKCLQQHSETQAIYRCLLVPQPYTLTGSSPSPTALMLSQCVRPLCSQHAGRVMQPYLNPLWKSEAVAPALSLIFPSPWVSSLL